MYSKIVVHTCTDPFENKKKNKKYGYLMSIDVCVHLFDYKWLELGLA